MVKRFIESCINPEEKENIIFFLIVTKYFSSFSQEIVISIPIIIW